MPRIRPLISCLLLVAILAIPVIAAGTLLSMSLGDMARTADLVFAGTVASTWTAAAPGTIITRVTFRDLAFGKGHAPGDSLILNVNGGTLLGRTVDDGEEPEFHAGDRCIVFARGDLGSFANHYRAVVGGWQGVFNVAYDSTSGMTGVRQRYELPLAAINGEGVVVADGKLAFTRLSEKDFLAAVGRIAEHPKPTATDSL